MKKRQTEGPHASGPPPPGASHSQPCGWSRPGHSAHPSSTIPTCLGLTLVHDSYTSKAQPGTPAATAFGGYRQTGTSRRVPQARGERSVYPTGTRRPGRPERSPAFVPGHSLHEPLPGRRLPRSPASAVGRLLGPSGGPGNKQRPQASRDSLPTLAGDTAPNAPAWALGRGQRARMASWLLGSARTRCSACWRPLARPRRCPTIQARRDEFPLPWSSLRGMCPRPRHPSAAPFEGKPPWPGTARAASDVSGSASCGLTTTTTPSRQRLWGGPGPHPRPGAAGLQGTTCPAVPVPLSHSAETRIQLHSRERQI